MIVKSSGGTIVQYIWILKAAAERHRRRKNLRTCQPLPLTILLLSQRSAVLYILISQPKNFDRHFIKLACICKQTLTYVYNCTNYEGRAHIAHSHHARTNFSIQCKHTHLHSRKHASHSNSVTPAPSRYI